MSVPLKDFRPELNERTHRLLKRIAAARGMHVNALGRQIIDDYVQRTIHEAKLILGQDDENPDEPESSGDKPESPGSGRSGIRR